MKFNFTNCVKNLRNTKSGMERNMYPHIRDLLLNVLGYSPNDIIVDSKQNGGNIPDLRICLPSGVKNITHDWAVMEVKGEPGVFHNTESRERIFNEKAKYINLETEYFVMIDPVCIVVRPVVLRSQLHFDPNNDIVALWEDMNTPHDFSSKFPFLKASGVLPALKSFRDGDLSKIAVVKVSLPPEEEAKLTKAEKNRLKAARVDFLGTVGKCTSILQNACTQALVNLENPGQGTGGEKGSIKKMQDVLDDFQEKWGKYSLSFDPIQIRGSDIKGDTAGHGRHFREVARYVRKNLAVAKLVARALPAHYMRTGLKQTAPFAAESANLILARILLMRFFEDHNFFGEKKFVCNGGITELQNFMEHRERGYAIVLRTAYEEGAKIYADAFDSTDLDWVLENEDLQVSRAIELTMMYLSRFDFSTISGDILTGIYDRFLDRQQRKNFGEFYTPPSIANYIVQRLGVKPDDVVFDPACGSGTFILSAFAHMTNNNVHSGLGDLETAEAVLKNIGGNDLNPFSAVMTQIQMLWNLLPLKEEIKKRLAQNGQFPEIRIADSANALQPGGLGGEGTTFGDFDAPVSDVVIGNPPYVRPERMDFAADNKATAFFKPLGSINKNLYNLFVYKALAGWCKKPEGDRPSGRIGFVIPLSFCDNKSNASLRKLFEVGGQFRIIEIVDMEAIASHIFDASVNPIILFAENRPASKEDEIIIRIAEDSCVIDKDMRDFCLAHATEQTFQYQDVWTADGRILTKLNKKRKAVLDKMNACQSTLADIACPYWAGKKGASIIERRITPPNGNFGSEGNALLWEEKIMLGMGAAFRHQGNEASGEGGMDFFKGENISACKIEGEPSKRNIVPESVNDPSFWAFRDILPSAGYAFLRITRGITAARFDPEKYVFLNTATLLFPAENWEEFPIDAVLLSNLFQFYYALWAREGVVTDSWSNLYPRNLRNIPWPLTLKKEAEKLENLRDEFLVLCENIGNRHVALTRALQNAGAVKFADDCRSNKQIVSWSSSMDGNGKIDQLNAPKSDSVLVGKHNGDFNILLDGEFDSENAAWFAVSNEDIAHRTAVALTIFHGRSLSQKDIQKMDIPKDAAAVKKFKRAVMDYDNNYDEQKLEELICQLDSIVGDAFGLSEEDIHFVQEEMKENAFLKQIGPNLPFSGKQKRGLSDSLSSPDRYSRDQDSLEEDEEDSDK